MQTEALLLPCLEGTFQLPPNDVHGDNNLHHSGALTIAVLEHANI